MNLRLLAAIATVGLTTGGVGAQPTPDPDGFHGSLFATPGGAAQPGNGFDPSFAQNPEEFVFGPPSGAPGEATRGLGRVWGGAEFLLGTARSASVPPLVTTGPASAGAGVAGLLGQPGTTPLFGGERQLGKRRTGVRAEGGVWFDRNRTWGLSASFASLFSTADRLSAVGDGTNVVNVPQFVLMDGATVQVPVYVGFPGLATGSVSALTQTTFAGGDINLRVRACGGAWWRIDALLGYRQLYLGDELRDQFRAVTTLPTQVGSGIDDLRTRNHFYGAQVGADGGVGWGRWSLEGRGAVALGANVSYLRFDRLRTLDAGNGLVTTLEQANVRDSMTYFGVVTEAGLRIGFRVADCTKLTFGYTNVSWWNVRRAQEQYAFSATLADRNTNYYAHMLSWGAEFRY